MVLASLDDLLSYYRSTPEDAERLIAVGESKADPALDPATLAGWTMLANELMNLDELLSALAQDAHAVGAGAELREGNEGRVRRVARRREQRRHGLIDRSHHGSIGPIRGRG